MGCNKSNVVLLVNVKFRDHGKKKQHTVASLSSVVTSLCHREAGKGKKKAQGNGGQGKKRKFFPRHILARVRKSLCCLGENCYITEIILSSLFPCTVTFKFVG